MNVSAGSSRLHIVQAFVRDIRSPEWGVSGQGLRFAISGGLVAAVNVTVTTVLHAGFAVRFEIALAIAFLVSIAIHFTLQRLFVWRHYQRFALPAHRQAVRYLCLCCGQYGLTALSTSQLPSLLSVPVEAVYLMTIVTVAALNFVVFRGRIFHPIEVGEGERLA